MKRTIQLLLITILLTTTFNCTSSEPNYKREIKTLLSDNDVKSITVYEGKDRFLPTESLIDVEFTDDGVITKSKGKKKGGNTSTLFMPYSRIKMVGVIISNENDKIILFRLKE